MRGISGLALLLSGVVAPDAVHRDSFGSEWTAADGVVRTVLYSEPIDVRPGQIILREDIPVQYITEPAAVINMASDLVDAQGNSVPLSQVCCLRLTTLTM